MHRLLIKNPREKEAFIPAPESNPGPPMIVRRRRNSNHSSILVFSFYLPPDLVSVTYQVASSPLVREVSGSNPTKGENFFHPHNFFWAVCTRGMKIMIFSHFCTMFTLSKSRFNSKISKNWWELFLFLLKSYIRLHSSKFFLSDFLFFICSLHEGVMINSLKFWSRQSYLHLWMKVLYRRTATRSYRAESQFNLALQSEVWVNVTIVTRVEFQGEVKLVSWMNPVRSVRGIEEGNGFFIWVVVEIVNIPRSTQMDEKTNWFQL